MKNYVQPGHNMTITAAAAITSGQGVLTGAMFGVAQGDAEAGDTVVVCRGGVYELPKTSAQAWTQGALIYWDNTNTRATTASSGNTLIGFAAADAANPSDTGLVLLDGAGR